MRHAVFYCSFVLFALIFDGQFSYCSGENCLKSWLKDYQCVYREQGFAFHWRNKLRKVEMEVQAETKGWVAISFSNDSILCDTVVYERKDEARINSVSPYTYLPDSHTFQILDDASDSISGVKAISKRGKINLRFAKEFGNGRCPILEDNSSTVFWAFGRQANNFISEFSNAKWNAFNVNWLASRQVSPVSKMENNEYLLKFIQPSSTRNSKVFRTRAVSKVSSDSSCRPSNLRGYKCSIDLRGTEFVLHWKPRHGKVALVLESTSSPGWMGIGWSPSGGMIGSEVVIGKGGSHPTIKVYTINGKSASKIVESDSFSILSPRLQSYGGKKYLKFERVYGTGKYPFNESSMFTTVIWAASETEDSEFSFHGLNYGAVQVNFANGNAVQLSSEKDKFRQIHGICMWIAFGVLLPLGVIFSRFHQVLNLMSVWFPMHWITQTLGAALAIASAAFAVVQFHSLDTAHGSVGCATVALVAVQFILGSMFRPPIGGKLRASWHLAHMFLGTIILLLGQVNIYLGLWMYESKTYKPNLKWAYIVSIASSVVMISAFVILEVIRLRTMTVMPVPTSEVKPSPEKEAYSTAGLKGVKSKRWRSLRHNNSHWASSLPH